MHITKGGIAFFDSGIGGLTVLDVCEKKLEDQIFYYYGDNTHAPYGNLPRKKIRRYVLRAFRKFRRLKVKAAVVACNTATAVCVEELRKKYSFPIVGAEPAVFTAAAKGGEVLVLATRATCESERFLRLCRRAEELFPDAKVVPAPCDLLAGEIEKRLSDVTYDYTRFLPRGKPTSVVLGCTHYIYIKEEIEKYYGCKSYDGNEGMARRLCALLKEVKGRDGRPPSQKPLESLGFLTTSKPLSPKTKRSERKPNKRLQKSGAKRAKYEGEKRLFFLGKQRKNNENTYKQMFAHVKQEKRG